MLSNCRYYCSLILGVVLLYSCTNEPQGLESLDPVCFDSQILPLIQSSCATSGCHNASSQEEGFNFTTYDGIMKAVKAGKPKQSELYQVLTSSYGTMMPPSQPLSEENRNLIKIWIEQGAKETHCTTDNTDGGTNGTVTKNDTVCFNLDIFPVISSSCAKSGCHDATTHKEGVTLTSYSNIKSLVSPGNYTSSKLYKVITGSGEDKMPPSPNADLTQDQINKIKQWISDGAINSDCAVETCDTARTISFASQVWPVIQNNCLGCHPASGTTNGVSLGNYAQVKTIAATIRNSKSLLSGVINQLTGFKPMPQNSKLIVCQIAVIDKWIAQEAINN
jgi:uncharacterized membrane protein